jgi:hypothetical protein
MNPSTIKYKIAHRGNVFGSVPYLENSPYYIDEAIRAGFDVEVDIRATNFASPLFYLGHDAEEHLVSLEWLALRRHKLWFHCKNEEAYATLPTCRRFIHSVTPSAKIAESILVWHHANNLNYKVNSVAVMPEFHKFREVGRINETCMGVCSDYVGLL